MGIIDRIKSLLTTRDHVRQFHLQTELKLKYFVRAERLNDCIYNSKEPGVTDDRHCEHEVIVSLTTFGKRLYDVATTIESIMQGTVLPNKIVLWLGEEHKGEELPLSLQLQQKRGLQIEYCKDIRSYTKLIPSLKKYPESIIITIDDDLAYERDLIENLLRAHKANPTAICANRIHEIVLGNDGKPIEYVNWKWGSTQKAGSPLNFLTGVGGVLYPPHCFDEEVFNEQVFLDICKFADDIWFYAMALKKGTPIVKSFTHSAIGEDYVVNPNVQDVGLHLINCAGSNLNDQQFKVVMEHYGLLTLLKK